jgi:predicted ATP-dependent Lon-type protease
MKEILRSKSVGFLYAISLHHFDFQCKKDFERAKRVFLPIASAADLGTVPADLIGSFNLVFYNSAEDAVLKALGVE